MRHSEVIFFEKPSSIDEIEIARVISSLPRALLEMDKGELFSYFVPDAVIESLEWGRSFNVSEYKDALSSIPSISRLNIVDVIIRMKKTGFATVYGNLFYIINGVRHDIAGRCWKLEKRNGNWLIISNNSL